VRAKIWTRIWSRSIDSTRCETCRSTKRKPESGETKRSP
jgi:hypothetical protein